MAITDIIDKSILAIYRNPHIAKEVLLKGGSAVRLFENNISRLSIDADFSLAVILGKKAESIFFERIHKALSKEFRDSGYFICDFSYRRKPSKPKPGFPATWGGWACTFKLVPTQFKKKALEVQRRNALIPEGSNSSKMEIDISDGEYCGAQRSRVIRGVKIHGYTRELLVLEKIRAICQQHHDYKFTTKKNRARDFYDIQQLTQHMDDDFIKECKRHLANVFEAKSVPIQLLSEFWNDDFINEQGMGFQEVIDTVSGKIQSFDVYVQYLRHLIKQIHPETVTS